MKIFYFFLLLCFSLFIKQAISGGIGIYNPKYTLTNTGEMRLLDSDGRNDTEQTFTGFGIYYDTNLSQSRVYGYRIALSWENGHEVWDGVLTFDHWKISLDQIFAFGVLRLSFLRLWIGPELRIQYMFDREDLDDFDNWRSGIGIGPTLGAYWHLGPLLSLGTELGWRFVYNYGEVTTPGDPIEYVSYENEMFLRLAIAFRFK